MGALRPCRDGVEDERLPVSGRAKVAAGSLACIRLAGSHAALSFYETTRSCWTGWSSSTASSSSTTSVRVPSAFIHTAAVVLQLHTECVCVCVCARAPLTRNPCTLRSCIQAGQEVEQSGFPRRTCMSTLWPCPAPPQPALQLPLRAAPLPTSCQVET